MSAFDLEGLDPEYELVLVYFNYSHKKKNLPLRAPFEFRGDNTTRLDK